MGRCLITFCPNILYVFKTLNCDWRKLFKLSVFCLCSPATRKTTRSGLWFCATCVARLVLTFTVTRKSIAPALISSVHNASPILEAKKVRMTLPRKWESLKGLLRRLQQIWWLLVRQLLLQCEKANEELPMIFRLLSKRKEDLDKQR